MKPIWISHRGLCQRAGENTTESFRAALEAGFTHLETDLRVSADGHLLLAHDRNLFRLTGRDLDVCASNRAELEAVRLNGGERLLFFDRFFPEFASYHWIFDIKPEFGRHTLERLLDLWRDPHYEAFFSRRVRFLLWDKAQRDYLLQRRPEAVCMADLRACQRAALACNLALTTLAGLRAGKTYALPPSWRNLPLMREAVVRRYWHRGARVLAYLPRTEADARRALALGVDEILTDHPIVSGQ